MKIKNEVVDTTEFLDSGEIKTDEPKQKVQEYSFLNDDIIEMDRLIDPMIITPQDGLKYSIINIIAYALSSLVNDYMNRYCQNANTTNERPCLLTMKNEFLENLTGLHISDDIAESSIIAGTPLELYKPQQN